jgi:hypothetical protein
MELIHGGTPNDRAEIAGGGLIGNLADRYRMTAAQGAGGARSAGATSQRVPLRLCRPTGAFSDGTRLAPLSSHQGLRRRHHVDAERAQYPSGLPRDAGEAAA